MAGSGLREYIAHKRNAMQAAARERPSPEQWRERVEALAVADDRSGARKLRIREWDFVSDSGPAFGGQSLGPSSPELLCGVLATCLAHTYEIAAATMDVPLDRVEVRVTADNNDAGLLGIDSPDPDLPWNLAAHVNLEANGVEDSRLEELHAFVRERCPLSKLIRMPNEFTIVTG